MNDDKEDGSRFDFSLMSAAEVDTLEIDEAEDMDELGALEEFTGKFLESNMQERIPMLFRLMRRCVVFLSLLVAGLFMMFAIGNFQMFLDSDLNLLLFMTTSVSILLSLMSASSAVVSFVCIFLEKRLRYVFFFFGFVVTFCVAVALVFFSRGVNILSFGITV